MLLPNNAVKLPAPLALLVDGSGLPPSLGCATSTSSIDVAPFVPVLATRAGEVVMEEPSKQELKVFIATRESTCGECGENLGTRAWITLAGEQGALCLACADLEHLVFLPAGNMALTRRARKHSTLSAVVLRWSRARKRYERRGLLVEEPALTLAEGECLADDEVRTRRRLREADRRVELDREYVQRFAAQIRAIFPGCPTGTEVLVAEHACLKYSGRVGRSRSARGFEREAVQLAVAAHVRHVYSRYDKLLSEGVDRLDARRMVATEVTTALESWQRP